MNKCSVSLNIIFLIVVISLIAKMVMYIINKNMGKWTVSLMKIEYHLYNLFEAQFRNIFQILNSDIIWPGNSISRNLSCGYD